MDNFPSTPARLEIGSPPPSESPSGVNISRTPSSRKFKAYNSQPGSAASSFSEVSQYLQGDEADGEWGASRFRYTDDDEATTHTEYSPDAIPVKTLSKLPPPRFDD